LPDIGHALAAPPESVYIHVMARGEFRECGACLGFALRRSARAMAQHYNRALRPSGLRGTQFSMLVVLAEAGPLPMTRLAERLNLERTTLTRNLRPLAEQGWITIGDEPDRRVRLVSITAQGRLKARTALPLWRQALLGRLGIAIARPA
jgi:DNA-binding MarR family transcriptional regulator